MSGYHSIKKCRRPGARSLSMPAYHAVARPSLYGMGQLHKLRCLLPLLVILATALPRSYMDGSLFTPLSILIPRHLTLPMHCAHCVALRCPHPRPIDHSACFLRLWPTPSPSVWRKARTPLHSASLSSFRVGRVFGLVLCPLPRRITLAFAVNTSLRG